MRKHATNQFKFDQYRHAEVLREALFDALHDIKPKAPEPKIKPAQSWFDAFLAKALGV